MHGQIGSGGRLTASVGLEMTMDRQPQRTGKLKPIRDGNAWQPQRIGNGNGLAKVGGKGNEWLPRQNVPATATGWQR